MVWNQWKLSEKTIKDSNFDLFWGPKWPQNWASEAQTPHAAESTCNEHVKQYWCETNENLWESDKDQNFDLLWGPKWPKNWAFEAYIVNVSESSSIELIKQDWCKSRGNVLRK